MGKKIKIDIVSQKVGVTPQWLRRLAEAGVIPPIEKNMIDESECYLGLAKYWREMAEDTDDDLLAARTRKVRAEGERQELALARDRGEVLPRQWVLDALDGLVQRTKFAIIQLSTTIPGTLLGIPPREQRKVIYTACWHLLDMLYKNIKGDLGEYLKRNPEFQKLLKTIREYEKHERQKIEDIQNKQESKAQEEG